MINQKNLSRPRLANLHINTTKEAISMLNADNYWIKHWWDGSLHKAKDSHKFANNKRLIRILKKWLPHAPNEVNARDNVIERLLYPFIEVAQNHARQLGCTPLQGYSSDGYVYTWVNKTKFLFMSYCEGDVSIVTCKDEKGLNREMSAFFKSVS